MVKRKIDGKKKKNPKAKKFQKRDLAWEPTATSAVEKYDNSGSLTINPASGGANWVAIAAGLLINGIVQGLAPNNARRGRKLLMKSILVRYFFNAAGAGTGALTGRVRWVIVYDKAPNFNLCSIANIFNTDNFLSPLNLDFTDRFVIIHDETTDEIFATGTGGRQTAAGKFYKKINLVEQFDQGTLGTIADITTGAMYITCSCSGTYGAGTGPGCTFNYRIRFEDP